MNRLINFYSREVAKNSLLTQSAGLGVLAAINAGFAVLMSWYVVALVGVGTETDSFFASAAIPQFVFTLLVATLLPIMVPVLATRADEEFHRDLWSFFTLTCAILILIATMLYVSTSAWVALFVPGFTPSAQALTVSLVKLQLVNAVLNGMIVTLWAAHHARHRFAWIELSAIVANLAGFLFLVVTLPRFGIWAAALNTIFYNSLKLAFLLPILGRYRRPNWRSATVVAGWHRLKPLLPGQIYLRTDPLLDRILMSMSATGTLSLFYVAQQIFANAILLLGKAVVAPLTPKLALQASEKAWHQFRQTYRSRLLLIFAVTALGLSLVIAGAPLLRFLKIATVTQENFRTLWLIMVALGGMLVAGALVQATASAFYAMGDTKTPSKISAIVYTFYIPVKIAAFFRFGLMGVAISMSGYFAANFIVQLLVLRTNASKTHVASFYSEESFNVLNSVSPTDRREVMDATH